MIDVSCCKLKFIILWQGCHSRTLNLPEPECIFLQNKALLPVYFLGTGSLSLSLCLFSVLVLLSVSLPSTPLPAVSVRACMPVPTDLCCCYKRRNSKVPHSVCIVLQEEWAVLLTELRAGPLPASGRLSCDALSCSKGVVMRLLRWGVAVGVSPS